LTISKCKDDTVTRSGCGSLSRDDGKSVGSLSSRVVDLVVSVDTPQELAIASSNADRSETSRHTSPLTESSITVVDAVVFVDTPDVLTNVTRDTDRPHHAGNPSPAIETFSGIKVVDVVKTIDTPDVVTIVSSARDLHYAASIVSPFTIDSITLVDVSSFSDTIDLLALVNTDGDLSQLASNEFPFAVKSSTEIDVVSTVDTPDIISITSRTDLHQIAIYLNPATFDSITVVDASSPVSRTPSWFVDTPDNAVVGHGDLLECTRNSTPIGFAELLGSES